MQNGWIKLHRKFKENPIYKNSKAVHCWIECLLRASHKEGGYYLGRKKIILKAGEFIMGRNEFGKSVGISGSTAWFWIMQFKVDKMIDIKKTTKGSLCKIIKWKEYQALDSNVDNKKTANEQQMNTDKNDKNDKNVERVDTPAQFARKFFSDNDLQDKISDEISKKCGVDGLIIKNEILKFIHYWTEPNKSGSRVRWELQKTFDVKRRLYTWLNNINKFNNKIGQNYDFTTK